MNIDLSKLEKLITYYNNINQLTLLYLNELSSNIESKDTIYIINNTLEKYKIKNDLEKINKLLSTKNDLNKYFTIYELLDKLYYNITELINTVISISIYEEKTLLSDTSKNNINANKEIIADLYKKIQQKYDKYLNEFLNNLENEINLNFETYMNILYMVEKNINLIPLYNKLIYKYLKKSYSSNNDDDNLTRIILFNNNILKNQLLKNDDHYNDLTKEFNYLFKNNFITLSNYKNKIHKFHNLHIIDSFTTISDIFNKYLNIKVSTTNKKNNLIVLYKSLLLLKQQTKRDHCLLIIDSNVENINYNIYNLLNDDIQLLKNQGINQDYINKTKVIVTKNEYNNLPSKYKFQNDIYISDINKISIVNTYNQQKNINSSELLVNTNFIVIINKGNYYHLMLADNNSDYIITFNQIKTLLLNNSNFMIENYNQLNEDIILNNINNVNFLDLYKEEIAKNYQATTTDFNINIIKNKISTSIKNKKKLNMDSMMQLIIDAIVNYLKDYHKIDYNSELYLTLYSNINNFYSKLRKEIFDNYNSIELLSNNTNLLIDDLTNQIYTINNNILDKYYIISLSKKYN